MMNNGLVMDNNNMSNLASSSNEGNISSSKKRNDEDGIIIEDATQPAAKKKRNLPGNPDPEGEIIALSPRTLMATNRFVCEICHKGFQREQNLQLHRRGHNLPWKLKQRTNKEVKKKFYVCPEPTCVHHDPSRALGDLTGVKKHYCRKHGEKKWKCEKCTKSYAVQSDWKAHSKVCGTREYRCDCGTVFSRRDSFITHRAFCDALAQESARTVTQNPLLSSQLPGTSTSIFNLQTQLHNQASSQLKREQDLQQQQQNFNLRPEIPPWLVGPPSNDLSSQLFTSSRLDQVLPIMSDHHHNNLNNPNNLPFSSSTFQITKPSPHMSATALLQKAAEMGVTMSKTCQSESSFRPHQAHMSAPPEFNSASSGGAGLLGLSSSEEEIIGNNNNNNGGLIHGLESFMNKASASAVNTVTGMEQISSTLDVGFERSSANNFEDMNFNGMITTQSAGVHLSGNGASSNEGLTRDFLGLTAFPQHRDFINMAGLDQIGSSSYDHHQQNQNQPQWHG